MLLLVVWTPNLKAVTLEQNSGLEGGRNAQVFTAIRDAICGVPRMCQLGHLVPSAQLTKH